ncbi:hypothetical protein K1X76_07715 [bacterium]|nr:hypothetical protein [bacterium]
MKPQLYLITFISVLACTTAEAQEFTLYKSANTPLAFSLPKTAYNEAKEVMTVSVKENKNTLYIGTANKLSLSDNGIFEITVQSDVPSNQIESWVKKWTDKSCQIYEIKKSSQNLSTVTFGPAERLQQNYEENSCVPDHPVKIQYSQTSQTLVKIEAKSQDCIFFNPPNINSNQCLEDDKFVQSIELRL